jgi:hypothetical protein
LLSQWEPPANGFSLEFVDVSVTLGEDSTADVTLTAKISNHDAPSGQPIADAREVSVTMKKLDGDWVIAEARGANTLRRP